MKKLISMLLVLVMTLSLLAGLTLAADMPVEATQADAGVVVSFEGSDEKYYFENLTRELILWACGEIPGAPTFTLLKDLTIENAAGTESSARNLEIPANNSEWYKNGQPSSTGKLPVTFDLSGHTMTYTGASNMIHTTRWGFTVKNGTMIYNGQKDGRAMFVMGGTTSQVANSSGTNVYSPELKLENVTCISNAPSGGIVTSYLYATKVDVKDSFLWSKNSASITLHMSDQSKIGSVTPYAGEYAPIVTVKNSVLGSGKHYVFSGTDTPGAQLNVTDSVLVTNHSTGRMLKSSNPMKVNASQDSTVTDAWTGEAAGEMMIGKAFVYGAAPSAAKLPFEDVAETDWFYGFVSEMYAKKIINGMTETTFVPNGNLTYGQALKLIVVGLGVDAPAATGHWASGYLALAKENEWLTSDVDLDGAVTRLAFCRIAASAKNLVEQPESNPFKDTSDPAVLALVKAGVISGMSADTFAPDATLTRAQIAKIISLLLKL